jgi:hypothetical protein
MRCFHYVIRVDYEGQNRISGTQTAADSSTHYVSSQFRHWNVTTAHYQEPRTQQRQNTYSTLKILLEGCVEVSDDT